MRNIEWVCSQQDNFASTIFLKCLRQAYEHCVTDTLGLREQEFQLCAMIWSQKQVECLEIGKELIRIFGTVNKSMALRPISEDLSKDVHGKTVCKHLLEKNGNKIYLQSLIPLSIDTKLRFMLDKVPQHQCSHYLEWLMQAAGIKFGTESESLLVDIVRFIIVNIQPSNEIIQSNVVQRYHLIGNIITQMKNVLVQTYILQALFFDWLNYDNKDANQIMLVEPAMLLMYRTVDKHPKLTEMLVEYLDKYMRQYDPSRVHEAMISVQSVFFDCERKQVTGPIKDLINHPNLRRDIQSKIKKMYRANEILSQNSASGRQHENKDPYKNEMQQQQNISNPSQQYFSSQYDQEMNDGQFSPPHDQSGIDAFADIDNLHNNGGQQSPQYIQEDIEPSQQNHEMQEPPIQNDVPMIESSSQKTDEVMTAQETTKQSEPVTQYNIDLFKDQQDNKNKQKSSSSSSSNNGDSQDNSDEDASMNDSSSDDSSSSGKSQQHAVQNIEVPQNVTTKYFSSADILNKFLKKRNKQNLKALLEDFCQKCTSSTTNSELQESNNNYEKYTELAFILFESMKDRLIVSDIIKLTKGWKDHTFVEFFNLLCQFNKVDANRNKFVVLCHLVRSLAQFDQFIESKFLIHVIVMNRNKDSGSNSVLQAYAGIFYSINGQVDSASNNRSSKVSIKQFIHKDCLSKLSATLQIKILNYLLVQLPEFDANYSIDNEQYFDLLLTFGTPMTLQKVILSIQTNQYSLVKNNYAQLLQLLVYKYGGNQKYLKSYHQQISLFQIINAHEFTNVNSDLISIILSEIKQMILGQRLNKNLQDQITGTIQGFMQTLNKWIQSKPLTHQQVFWSCIDFYTELTVESNESQSIRAVTRDFAQVILSTFFSQNLYNQQNKLVSPQDLIYASINELNSQDNKQQISLKRLNSISELFSHKMASNIIKECQLQEALNTVKSICNCNQQNK